MIKQNTRSSRILYPEFLRNLGETDITDKTLRRLVKRRPELQEVLKE